MATTFRLTFIWLFNILLASHYTKASSPWPDCSPQNDAHTPYNGTAGPYGPVASFHDAFPNKGVDRPLVVFHPTAPPKDTLIPVVAFMHGITAEIGMYQPNLELYASHGFVVIFPYINSPSRDKLPITTNTDGTFLLHAVEYAAQATANASNPLYGKLDLKNIVLAGHSMGATCSIMAGTHPNAEVALVVTQHPGICGPTGPPPWPSTWFPSDLSNVIGMHPVLFTTATNDGAFWPAPLTAKHELGCFNTATKSPKGEPHPATFIQFSSGACGKDGMRPPYDDSGHNCAFKEDVETPWVLTAMKYYAQQGGAKGNPGSACGKMLYGNATGSIASDPHVEKVVYTWNNL